MELARAAMNARDPMQGLRAIVALRQELVELEARYVADALREGRTWGQIANALGVSKQAAHKRHAGRVGATAGQIKAVPRRRLLVTGQARRVVQRARAEARAAGSAEVAPEHLLLALLRDPEARAARMLAKLGVPPERVRERVHQLVGGSG
jgi:ATP-dependent Clp protease ATP-binding subunit ClpA